MTIASSIQQFCSLKDNYGCYKRYEGIQSRQKGLTTLDFNLLAATLQQYNSLSCFDFSDSSIGDSEVEALVKVFQRTNSGQSKQKFGIAYFNLSKNNIGNAGAQAIGRALEKIEAGNFDIRNNQIGDDGIIAIVTGLITGTGQSRIVNFRFYKNPIGPKGAAAIMTILSNRDKLCFDNCELEDADAKVIAQALISGRISGRNYGVETLESISLNGNNISDVGANILLRAMQSIGPKATYRNSVCHYINRSISLSYNKVGDIGAAAIFETLLLADQSHSAHINLTGNLIGEKGLKLFRILKSSCRIYEGSRNNCSEDDRIWDLLLNDNVAALNQLIERGLNLNETDQNGRTLLWKAVFLGKIQIIPILSTRTINLNNPDIYGNSILDIAAGNTVDAIKLCMLADIIYQGGDFAPYASDIDFSNSISGRQNIALFLERLEFKLRQAGITDLWQKNTYENNILQYIGDSLPSNIVERIILKVTDLYIRQDKILKSTFKILNKIFDTADYDFFALLRDKQEELAALMITQRALFKSISKLKTVIFEPHILSALTALLEKYDSLITKTREIKNRYLSSENIIKIILGINEELESQKQAISVEQDPIKPAEETIKEDIVIGADLTHIFPVEEDHLSFDANTEIIKISELIREGNDRLQENILQAILLLGRTGSGKSTLAHLLTGKELQAIYDDETYALVIDATQPLQEIVISHNKASETKIPNKCRVQDQNIVIWDCPGFNDTDIAQEIANAFYIQKLFATSERLKFILVVADSEIMNNRGINFVETVQRTVNSFSSIEELKRSISLVITQAPSGKQAKHIINSIDRILSQNENIEPSVRQMTEYLKDSIYIFHAPLSEGPILNQTDILAVINTSREYYDSRKSLANMSMSSEAVKYSNRLLQIVSSNFNLLVETIISALSNPNECRDSDLENNIFIQNYNLIKNLGSSSIQYDEITQDVTIVRKDLDYLDHIKELKELFSKRGNINSFEDCLTQLKDVLRIFENFTVGSKSEVLKRVMGEYENAISLQFNYIKFFAEVCRKELPKIENFTKLFDQCYNMLSISLEKHLSQIKIEENREPEYYNKIKQYLNEYINSAISDDDKAKGYVKLGIAEQNDNNKIKALEYFIEATKYNDKLYEIYDGLGHFFYTQNKYEQAIECFKVNRDTAQVKACVKAWILEDPSNIAYIKERLGDYYTSITSYEKARAQYLEAYQRSNNDQVKLQIKNKFDNISALQFRLTEQSIDIINQSTFEDFKIVDLEFLSLIGQDIDGLSNFL